MGKTPIKIKSNQGTGRELVIMYGNVAANDTLTFVANSDSDTVSVGVGVSELVERLNLIPGMTVKYEKPIEVPSYLGAVVRRDDGMGGREQWVRYLHDGDSSLPWVSRTGNKFSNDDIAAVLANGAYEVQPEFPKNGAS